MNEREITLEDSAKLKPLMCPFCGSEPRIFEAPNHAQVICVWIECKDFNCTGRPSTFMCGTVNEAIKLWNKRK